MPWIRSGLFKVPLRAWEYSSVADPLSSMCGLHPTTTKKERKNSPFDSRSYDSKTKHVSSGGGSLGPALHPASSGNLSPGLPLHPPPSVKGGLLRLLGVLPGFGPVHSCYRVASVLGISLLQPARKPGVGLHHGCAILQTPMSAAFLPRLCNLIQM